MTTPRVSLVAFESRQSSFIFVAVPNERGRYLRTDRSVTLVGCANCGALLGEPCIGSQGYGGVTHVSRRLSARRAPGRGEAVDDVLEMADEMNLMDP